MSHFRTGRRTFLGSISAGLLAAASQGPQPLPVARPRATEGDRIEPAWDELLTVTVGNARGDIVGADNRAIQAAVNYVAGLGGGVVRILPGTYRFRDTVRLRSGVHIKGSGPETVLIKEPSVKTELDADSDWYDREITLKNPDGFRVGDGVFLRARTRSKASLSCKATLVARSGNRFKVDRMLDENFWREGGATAATLFALFDGFKVSGIHIEDITLDGNRANNENLNGNYGGCIFLMQSNDVIVRRVITRNFNGDGVSWQVSHDVRVEECQSLNNADLGLHPGSGSQRAVMYNNKLDGNGIGIYFCWGVKWSVAENNTILNTVRHGISIGHGDTDNLVRNNRVVGSKINGIRFRSEHDGPAFSPDRNRFEANEVIDTGGDEAVAVDVDGDTKAVELVRNVITESRGAAKRVGIRIGPRAKNIVLEGNRVEGFAIPLLDRRA